ncbi:MAG TPA: YjbH domain-containing protein, partial [Rhizomicrobium sp.]|nr:YjbH domain-containing protein [Rhizomicrobium sp.]
MRRFLIAGALLTSCASPLLAQEGEYESNIDLPLPTPSLYGGMGLLDTRNARFMPDGYFSLNVAIKSPDDRIAFTFQALPWLEATFRYSINYALAPVGQRALYDRSFDLKARLWEEGRYMPQIAIGLQDFIGTGVYSAEYVVASKRFGPVDLSMGMGWGRLASCFEEPNGSVRCSRAAFENPFCAIYATFCTRPSESGTGGSFLATDWFRGQDVGIFGGIEYNTPIPDLTLKVEYSPDDYAAESSHQFNTHVIPKNYAPIPVNAGLDYKLWGNVDLGVSVIGGREVAFDAALTFDPTRPNWPYRLDPPPPFVARAPGASGNIIPLQLNTKVAAASPAQFINLDNLPGDRPPDPSLLASPEYRVAEAFRKSGLVVTDGWITGDALVARVDTTNAPLPACSTLQDMTKFDNVVLVSGDWNPLETCSAPEPAKPAAAAVQLQATATASWQRDTLGRMRRSIEEQHLIVQGISIADGVVKVEIENDKYFRDTEAISRVARALSASAPPEIGAFQITTTIAHMPLTTVTISRSQVDALAHGDGTASELWSSSVLSDASPATDYENGASNPQFSWSIFPSVQTQLFDPNNPAYVGFGISGATRTELFPGLVLDNEATYGIWDNFGSITRPNDSQLPPVRTDIVSYLQKGFTGINDLTLTDYVKPASEVYARVTVGYIEQMFAGAGGEVLYRPFGQRWALGADIFDVWQRNFDDLFGLAHLCPVYPAPQPCPVPLQTYNVWTGHASLYVETPWNGVTAVVRAGRYLAGDYGGTLELYRRFDTGIIIGAWMTLTNVSTSKFGEGSFDKGIRIVIPTEFVLPFGTTTRFEEDLRPVQRDGGQILNNDATLYDLT